MANTSKKTTRTAPRSNKAAKPKTDRSNLVPTPPFETKTDHVIGMLRRKEGASLAEIMEVLGWKEHSVRALISATIGKGRKMPIAKSKAPGESTRYHIAGSRVAKN